MNDDSIDDSIDGGTIAVAIILIFVASIVSSIIAYHSGKEALAKEAASHNAGYYKDDGNGIIKFYWNDGAQSSP